MKILGVCGSLRADSSSRVALKAFAEKLPGRASFYIYDDVGKLPHFDDRIAPSVQVNDWRNAIKNADAVVICTPEYAFGVPGALKNALDWTVSSGEFVEKPTAIIVASTGGEHAFTSLKLTMSALSAKINDEMSLLISYIRAKIKEGKVSDENTLKALGKIAAELVKSLAEK